ncbi:MAG: methyltransferase domain-containing protein [Lachnospiraceae bacterium]|nr:methyltransferase domain-containing protein [Lachnospiraceae bacterium]
MFKIKEVADQFQINSNALRFYENKGLIHPVRDTNGYRMYSSEEVVRLQLIILLRKMDFSIDMIAQLLENKKEPIDLFLQQYQIVNDHIHSMTLVKNSLEKCVSLMFNSNQFTEPILSCMRETSALLAKTNQWEDKWGFDDWASCYDEDIRKDRQGLAFYKHYDKVIRRMAEKTNQTMGKTLEIGVGTGNLAGQLLCTQDITGIDQSANMLKEAKKKYPDLKVYMGTFLQIPFSNEVFDNVISSYAFHHCNEEEKLLALNEMKRVLKPNGRIIIADLMFETKEARAEFEKYCSPEEKRDLQDEYFADLSKLEHLFEDAGFVCTKEQIDDLIWIVTAQRFV